MYDASLILTSVAFGVGVCTRRHVMWRAVVYAAAASVLFRAHRLLGGVAAWPLHMHDVAAALLAMALTLRHNPSPAVRGRVALAGLFFLASHAVPDPSRSRACHAAGHLAIVAATWCPRR